jgi:hypothetical protein
MDREIANARHVGDGFVKSSPPWLQPPELESRPGDAAVKVRQPLDPTDLERTWDFMKYAVDLAPRMATGDKPSQRNDGAGLDEELR